MKKNTTSKIKKVCAGSLAALIVLASVPINQSVFANNENGLVLTQKTDGVNITLQADEGVFPTDAKLSVQRIDETDKVDKIENSINDTMSQNSSSLEKTYSYDIEVLDTDGKELQPNNDKGNVTVSFSNVDIPKEKSVEVYYVDDTLKSAEAVSSRVDTDKKTVEIAPEHFSIYTITVTGNSHIMHYFKGSSAATSYFMIYTADDLVYFRNVVNGAINGTITVSVESEDANTITSGVNVSTLGTNARLMDDINLNPGTTFDDNGVVTSGSPAIWVPIGLTTSARYGGTFNGDGHTICNLYAVRTDENGAGLFGWLNATACVKNLTIDGFVSCGAYSYAGGIAGYATSSTIINCTNKSYITGKNCIGGILGYGSGVTYTDCKNSGSIVTAGGNAGGICGYNDATTGKIESCSNSGRITTTSATNIGQFGGITAQNQGTIVNSFNTGNLQETHMQNVGGLVGYNYGKIYNSYNQGNITADNYVGGICAYNYADGIVQGVYNSGTVLVTNNVAGGIVGNNKGTLTHAYNTASVTSLNGSYVGGVLGCAYDVNISNTYNSGNVRGAFLVGGTVGVVQAAITLTDCYVTGTVTATTMHGTYGYGVGGIEGSGKGIVSANCYVYSKELVKGGSVTPAAKNGASSTWVGWVVGYIDGSVTDQGNVQTFSMPTACSVMNSFVGANTVYKTWTSTGAGENAPVFVSPASSTVYWNDSGNYANAFAGGDGTVENPYQIATAAQLGRFAYLTSEAYVAQSDDLYLKSNYVLTADINLAAHYWRPIGYVGNAFKGVLDGNGHTISGLNNKTDDYICGGLLCDNGGTIKNLVLTGVSITGTPNDGLMGVVARINSGTINNVNVSGSMNLTSNINVGIKVGGIVGRNTGTIINTITQINLAVTHVTTYSGDCVGGIAGETTSNNSKIFNCAATGKIVVQTGSGNSFVGGIVGEGVTGYIRNCYYYNATPISNTGTGNKMTGGITARAGNMIYYYYTSELKVLSDSAYLGTENNNKLSNAMNCTVTDLNTKDTQRTGYLKWNTLTSFSVKTSWIDDENYASAFAGGDGSTANPYQIATASQLARLAYLTSNDYIATQDASYLSKSYVLTAVVDLSAHDWVSIGGSLQSNNHAFSGVFDGANKQISGLTSTNADGLFASNSGTIKNIKLNINITGTTVNSCIGGLARSNTSTGKVNNAIVTGSINVTSTSNSNLMIACLIGSNSGTIINAISQANLTSNHTMTSVGQGGDHVGSIAGANSAGAIYNVAATGNVSATSQNYGNGVGGIVGTNYAPIRNCYFNGTIGNYTATTQPRCGGLAGGSASTGSIQYYYTTVSQGNVYQSNPLSSFSISALNNDYTGDRTGWLTWDTLTSFADPVVINRFNVTLNTASTNVTPDSVHFGTDKAIYVTSWSGTISPSEGYELPNTIVVKANNSVLTKTTDSVDGDYTYNQTTGEIVIEAACVIGNIEITANGVSNTYTITYLNQLGGVFVGVHEIGYPTSHTYDTSTSLKFATRPGYDFDGWYTSPNCTGIAVTSIGATDYTSGITLYAKWIPRNDTPYTVKHLLQGLDGLTYNLADTDNLTGTSDTNVTPATKVYTGFTAPQSVTSNIDSTGSSIISYLYDRESYTLSWDTDGGNALTGTYTSGSVKYDASITVPDDPTKDGFIFTGWDSTLVSKMPANDLTYKASWIPVGTTETKVEATLETPPVVSGLTTKEQFVPAPSADKGFTKEELDKISNEGASLKLALAVKEVDKTAATSEVSKGIISISNSANEAGCDVKYVLDLTVEKYIKEVGEEDYTKMGNVVELPSVIAVTVKVPDEINIDKIAVWRNHEGEVTKLQLVETATGKDGTFTVNKEAREVTIYTKYFSIYAIGQEQEKPQIEKEEIANTSDNTIIGTFIMMATVGMAGAYVSMQRRKVSTD